MSERKRRHRAHPGQQRGQRILVGDVWMLRYRESADSEGRRRRRTVRIGEAQEFSSFAEMNEAANRIIARLSPPRIVPGQSIRWTESCRRFCDIYLVNLARGSQRQYRSIIANQVEPCFRELHAHEITTAVVQQWISAQQRASIPRNTILSRFRVLRRIMRRCEADGFAASMPPTRTLELPRDTSIRRQLRTKAFTVEQMDALIRAAHPLWFRTLLAVLRFTGIRIGEALGLTWPNVEIAARAPIIHVQQSASDGVIGPTKTERGVRDIEIAPPLLEVLKAWQRECPPTPPLLVFPGRNGRPLTSAGVRLRRLRPLLVELKLPSLSFHAFRHGAAYAFLEAGGNPADVSALLGHADLRQTSAYAQSRREGRRDAVLAAAQLRKPFGEDETA
jgi:integrase